MFALAPGGLSRAARTAIAKNGLVRRVYEEYSFRSRQRELRERARQGRLSLHLGCGPRLLEGWVNVDVRRARKVLTMRLPHGLQRFENTSVRFIYASHVLEHIEYPAEALALVRECHRILQPGGVLRVVVPGIQLIIDAYVRDDAEFFEDQRRYHPEWCTTKLEHLMYALQQDGEHKYGFDFETIRKLFSHGGFSAVIRSGYNTSVHEELRIDYRNDTDRQGNTLSLYVDATKTP